ncbi:MAG: PAS domain-containing protein [Phycisphaerales bacterium JB043]
MKLKREQSRFAPWFRTYVLLALLCVVSVMASSEFMRSLGALYEDTIESQTDWNTHLSKISLATNVAIDARDSVDLLRRKERLSDADMETLRASRDGLNDLLVHEHDSVIEGVHEDHERVVDAQLARAHELAEQMRVSLECLMDDAQGDSMQILHSCSVQFELAFHSLLDHLSGTMVLFGELRDIDLRAHSTRAATMLRRERALAFLGLVLIGCAIWYGMFLKRSLARQHRRQRVLESAVESTQDAILIMRFDTLEIEYANQGSVDQFDTSYEELCSSCLEDLFCGFDASDFRSFMAPLVDDEVCSLLFETRHQRSDEGFRDVEVMIQPVPHESGVRRFMLVMRDITSKKCAEENFRAIVRGTTAKGEQFFEDLARALSEALGVNQVYIGETRDGGESVRLHVMFDRGTCEHYPHFDMTGVPCQQVIRHATPRVIGSGLQERFPDLDMLKEIDAHAYMSVPLMDTSGDCIGMLSVTHDSPITPALDPLETLELFAVRVVSEINQMRAHERFRSIVEGTTSTGDEFFEQLASSLGEALEVNQVVIAECCAEDDNLNAHVFYNKGELRRNVTYARRGTPCDIVCSTGVPYSQQEGLQESFPEDEMLAGLDAHSYIGLPLLASDGEVIGVLSVLHDGEIYSGQNPGEIVGLFAARAGSELDRLRSERRLRESERRFNLAIEAAGAGLWDWEPETNNSYISNVWYRMFGYDKSDFETDVGVWIDLVHPEDLARVRGVVSDHIEGKTEECRFDYRIRTHDGSYRWVMDIGRIIERDEEGNASRLTGVTIDIDQLKRHEADLEQAQRKLGESEQRLDLALRGANIGLWDTDLSTGEAFFSDILYTMLGYTPGEFPAELDSWRSILHPEDLERGYAELDRHIAGETELFSTESRVRTKSGEYMWIHDIGRIVEWNPDGTPRRMIGVHLDIDRRKRYQGEIEEARRLAEAASRTKTEFLANMSHEIRTPMTAILGFTDLLRQEDTTEAQREEYLSTIQQNGGHLLQIINDILDISKIDVGKLRIESVETDPGEIFGGVHSMFSQRANASDIELVLDLAPDLPARVLTDPMRLRQILINLVGNALKFTRSGAVTIRCGFEHAGTTRLVVTIEDTGIGMDQETLRSLFTPFTQADATTTREFGGTGLGLAISHRLVGLLGGSIDVESERGHGSRFRFSIPVGEIDGDDLSTSAPRHAGDQGSFGTEEHVARPGADTSAIRVLLAEDGKDNQRLFTTLLTRVGMDVTIVENGRDAVERVLEAEREGEPFDVVLMDMQMPVLDGYEATRSLVERGARTPIIALTAHAMEGDRARCLSAGCVEYLTKPVDRQALISMCARFALAGREAA